MEKKKLEQQLNAYNLKNLRIVAAIIISQIVLNLVVNMSLYLILDIAQSDYDQTYLIPYTILCASSLMIFFIPESKEAIINHILRIYLVIILATSGWITVLDQIYYNHQLIYTSMLLISVIFIILPRLQMILMVLLAGSSLIVTTFLLRESMPHFHLNIIYLLTITGIATVLSGTLKYSHRDLIVSRLKLIEEAEVAAKLTKELQQANKNLEKLALFDPLTNLPNRLAFNQYQEMLSLRTQEIGHEITAMVVDIDSFKQYNDFYGHLKGDEVLREVGRILNETAGCYEGFVARWGGEEFILFFDEHSPKCINAFCEMVVAKIREAKIPHETSEAAAFVTISLGSCTGVVHDANDITKVIQLADQQLYEAKHNGKNQYLHVTMR